MRFSHRTALAAVGLLSLALAPSMATAHDWYSGHRSIDIAAAPDWYGGYQAIDRVPPWDSFVPCCNTVDCKQYDDVEELTGGIWFKELNYVSPWSRIQPSPDGKWHACKMAADKIPRCVFGPKPSF